MVTKPTYEALEQRVRGLEEELSMRKEAEEALLESEERYRQLFEEARDGIFLADAETGILVECNHEAAKLVGRDKSELIGQRQAILHPPHMVKEGFSETFKKHLGASKGQILETQVVTKNGEIKEVAIKANLLDIRGRKFLQGVFHDVTEHKRAEEQLRQALRTAEDEKLKTRSIIESVGEPLGIIDTDFRFLYQNKVHRDSYGSHTGEKCYKAIKNRDEICEGCQLAESFNDGNIHTKERIVPGDEGPVYVVNTVSPLRDSSGEIVAGVEVIRDITEWRRAEEATKRAYAELDQIFNTSADGMRVVDREFNVFRVNDTFVTLSGIGRDEAVGKKCYEVFHGPMCHTSNCPLTRILAGEERVECDTDKRHKDGTTIPCVVTATPFRGSDGELIGIVENFRDITERKRAEEERAKLEAQLQQAQKMEAIGTLAGGIAHDFNNLLMAIQGHTSLISLHINADHADFEHIKGIEAMVRRGANLTKQLLGLAKGGKYEVTSTDLNALIENNSDMFGRTKKETRIHNKYQKEIWPVEVDRGQIDQVLLNLYVNAWQAMPGGGDLYIETRNVVLDKDATTPFGMNPGNYVQISITDTGVGMDAATQKRIFDPFFTTKEMGHGTGLGLASVYGIVKNHGGIINVHSEKGKGSTFNIYLPASEKEAVIDERRPVEQIVQGSQTVLIVDDENMVLYVGKEMLKELGYKVFVAGSGKEAVDIYRKYKDEIDLVILDVIMPDMGGGEVYDRIKEINPDGRVLLSSGYSINSQAGEILERGCDGFIQKPFDIKALSYKIKEILEEK